MVNWKLLTRVQLFAIPWTVACQTPLSMEFSRQGSWSVCYALFQEIFPHPGTEPRSPALQADSLPSEPPGKWQRSNWMTLETNKLWKILKEMGKPDPHICLLRKLYMCVKKQQNRHETTDWFKIVKGIQQGYIVTLLIYRVHHAKCQAG